MTDIDTRERLEADAAKTIVSGFVSIDDMKGWLDRQAAITELEAKRCKPTHMPLPVGGDGELIAPRNWMTDGRRVVRCVGVAKGKVLYRDKPAEPIKQGNARLWRMVYVNSEHEVIGEGDLVYGSDGTRWRVTGFQRGHSHPVRVEDERGLKKQLKPSWCSHKQPATVEGIVEELRDLAVELGTVHENKRLMRLADMVESLGGAR